MADNRSFTGGNFLLDINGETAGYVKKFSGLALEGDVVANDLGPDNCQKKTIANWKWTPGKATIGIGMGSEMYQWMKAAFDKGYATKDGAITSADANFKAQSTLDFKRALITEVTVPKLDGSSKDSAYFDIGWESEEVRWIKGDGKDIRGKVGMKQKQWLCCNFKVEIASLPCTRIATVDSFTWKCAVATDMCGAFVENSKHPAKVTVPDLKLGISMADHQAWADAAKSWFVDGNRMEDKHEMQGAIIFYGPNMKDELGRINLENVGFKKISEEDREANTEKIARFNVELYVEKMTFEIKSYDAAK